MKKSILLLFVSLFCLTGCGENEGTKEPTIIENNDIEVPTVEPEIEPNYMDFYFVYNNQSSYTIVIPKEASSNEIFAANEINTMLLKACKCTLPIKRDNEVADHTASSQCIYLGRTRYLDNLNLTVPNDVGRQGFIIKNVDKSIVISGTVSEGIGTLNGVYEFLKQQVGYACYGEDEIVVNEYNTVNLVSIDLQDKPSLNNFIGGSGVYSDNETLRKRTRTMDYISVLGAGKITPYHNTFVYLPKGTYQADNPEWYSTSGTQVCYTARGNSAKYELMVETVFERMLQEVQTYNLNIITFTMEDEPHCCTCDACKRAKK